MRGRRNEQPSFVRLRLDYLSAIDRVLERVSRTCFEDDACRIDVLLTHFGCRGVPIAAPAIDEAGLGKLPAEMRQGVKPTAAIAAQRDNSVGRRRQCWVPGGEPSLKRHQEPVPDRGNNDEYQQTDRR